jgi:hypothetical protein
VGYYLFDFVRAILMVMRELAGGRLVVFWMVIFFFLGFGF